MKYFGSFPIVERIGIVDYKLLFPPLARIHLVFHVSMLKKCEGQPPLVCISKPLLLNEKGYPLQPQFILGNRIIMKNDQWKEEVLTQ